MDYLVKIKPAQLPLNGQNENSANNQDPEGARGKLLRPAEPRGAADQRFNQPLDPAATQIVETSLPAENCHLIVPVASMSANTSDARQTVARGPSLTGSGNLPSRTPCHHVDLLIGMSGGTPRFLSPRIWASRKNPYLGMNGRCMFDHLEIVQAITIIIHLA